MKIYRHPFVRYLLSRGFEDNQKILELLDKIECILLKDPNSAGIFELFESIRDGDIEEKLIPTLYTPELWKEIKSSNISHSNGKYCFTNGVDASILRIGTELTSLWQLRYKKEKDEYINEIMIYSIIRKISSMRSLLMDLLGLPELFIRKLNIKGEKKGMFIKLCNIGLGINDKEFNKKFDDSFSNKYINEGFENILKPYRIDFGNKLSILKKVTVNKEFSKLLCHSFRELRNRITHGSEFSFTLPSQYNYKNHYEKYKKEEKYKDKLGYPKKWDKKIGISPVQNILYHLQTIKEEYIRFSRLVSLSWKWENYELKTRVYDINICYILLPAVLKSILYYSKKRGYGVNLTPAGNISSGQAFDKFFV